MNIFKESFKTTVEIRTFITSSYDSYNQKYIDGYSAVAFFRNEEIAKTEYNVNFSTEKKAIQYIKEKIKVALG